MRRPWIAAFIFPAAAVLLWLPMLGVGFLSDDFEAVAVTQGNDALQRIFTQPIGGNVFRPLGYLSFFVDRFLWGTNAVGWHVDSVVLHGVNAFLLAVLAWHWFRKRSVAGLAGALFLIYPAHHEAVTWISGRFDVLATTFVLSGLLSVERALAGKRRFLWLAAAMTVAAALTKEAGAVLPALILLRLLADRATRSRKTLGRYAGSSALALLVALGIRAVIVGDLIGGYRVFGISVTQTLSVTDLRIFLRSPFDLLAKSINTIFAVVRFPSLKPAFESVWPSLMVIVALTIMLIAVHRKVLRTLAFVLAGLYLTLTPVLPLLRTTSRTLESTRFWYLPSAALCLVIAVALAAGRRRWLSVVLTAFIALSFIGAWLVNALPWRGAGAEGLAIQKDFARIAPTVSDDAFLLFKDIPDNRFGAYVFRRGWGQYLDVSYPGRFTRRTAIGRSYESTFASCQERDAAVRSILILIWQARQRSFQEGRLAGNDQSRQTATAVQQWAANVALPGGESLWTMKNFDGSLLQGERTSLKTHGIGQLAVEGPAAPPALISDLTIEAAVTAKRPTIPVSLYWAGAKEPFNEYQRHLIFPLSADGQRHTTTIEFCRYAAWWSSTDLLKLRLQFPADLQTISIYQLSLTVP